MAKKWTFLLLGNLYFWMQKHEILANFHASHIKIGQAVPTSSSNEFWLISIIRILISIISRNRWWVTLETLVGFWCVIHEIWLKFRVDVKSAFRNINFPIAKKFIFLPYANLCKLDSGTAILTFYYAEPSKDLKCQVSFFLGYLHRSHQSLSQMDHISAEILK